MDKLLMDPRTPLYDRLYYCWKEYYSSRTGLQLVEDCLEFSGMLDRDFTLHHLGPSFEYGFQYGDDFSPLANTPETEMREWLIDHQLNLVEGESVESLKERLDRMETPMLIEKLLKELEMYKAVKDQVNARKARTALRKLGHYISRQG